MTVIVGVAADAVLTDNEQLALVTDLAHTAGCQYSLPQSITAF